MDDVKNIEQETTEVTEEVVETTAETQEPETVQAQAAGTPEEVVELEDQHVTIDNVAPGQSITAEDEQKEESVEELKAKIALHEARIAELEEIESKWVAAQEAEAQALIAAKKEKLSNFAKNSGLDITAEEVASAIESMNYEQLVSLVLNAGEEEAEVEPENVTAEEVVNPLVRDNPVGSWLYQKQ